IGHWEGDTLVVDVVGLTDETWLGGGGATGRAMYTSIHSDQEHVIERWSRVGDVLSYEATVEDPVALEKPWVVTPRRVKHAGADAGRDRGEVGRCRADARSRHERAVDDSAKGESDHGHRERRTRAAGVGLDRRRVPARDDQGRRQGVQGPGHGGRQRDGRI